MADISDNQINNLRPVAWQDFIGQVQTVKALQIAIKAAKERGEVMEHTLLYGPPGLGKTTLAMLIAKELGVSIKISSGPAITKSGDLASMVTSLETGDILFIDEIHRLNKTVEETLYPAMEDFCLDLIIGKGPGARSVRLDLNRFTIIGATTQAGSISSPLRDRFGLVHRLKFYSPNELQEIIARGATRLGYLFDEDSALEVAKRSRGTARIALKLMRRVRDYAEIEKRQKLNLNLAKEALAFYQVDSEGLDDIDRRLLETIIKDHHGGPVGLKTLAAIIAEDVNTITDVYEPFLMQSGYLTRSAHGRMATAKAYKHLGITPDG